MSEKYRIESYSDMGDLSEERLLQATQHEEAVFGFETNGFGEYLFCSNQECRRIQSIDEVHGLTETAEGYQEFLKIRPDFKPGCCPDCDSEMLFFNDPTFYAEYMGELFRGSYGSILIDNEEDKIRGVAIVKPGKFREIFDEDLNYLGGFEYETCRKNLSQLLNTNVTDETLVNLWNRIGIAPGFRSGNSFGKLFTKCINQTDQYDNLPCIGGTMYESPIWALVHPIGFEAVEKDTYGHVLAAIDSMNQVKYAYNLSKEEFIRKFGPKRKEVIKWQQKRTPKFKEAPKHYLTCSMLNEFQKIINETRQKSSIQLPQ